VIGPAIADAVTGQYAAQACLAALLERTKTGKGRRIDISMLEAMAHFNLDSFTHYYSVGEVMGPLSRPVVSQSYTFECADGKWIAIHMSSPAKFWEGMLAATGQEQLATRPALRRTAGADQAPGRPDRDPDAGLPDEVARCVVRPAPRQRGAPFARLRLR
jgi:crotonobetainyl-CoA:carnitine CoA-transferase CaiB-like acyl-CoA transferase